MRREKKLEPTSARLYEELADERADSPLHKWQFPVAIASLILGIAISLQFRSTSGAPSPNLTRTDIVANLRAVETERNRLAAELTELREKGADPAGTGGEELRKDLEAARLQAGLTALKGPGIVVRLSDSPRQPGPDEIPYDFIVHDIDLSVLVNELWASGAEAVAVSDQRIVARSSIRCVGPTVLVNTNRIASPFIVKAIGDVDHLEGGLKMPGGYLDSMSRLTQNGGEVVISRMRELQVPSYQGSLIYRYAVPAEEPDQDNPALDVGDVD
jgi:uncharacterized protein YlxW (UPF0749 family)